MREEGGKERGGEQSESESESERMGCWWGSRRREEGGEGMEENGGRGGGLGGRTGEVSMEGEAGRGERERKGKERKGRGSRGAAAPRTPSLPLSPPPLPPPSPQRARWWRAGHGVAATEGGEDGRGRGELGARLVIASSSSTRTLLYTPLLPGLAALRAPGGELGEGEGMR
eukprot:711916-Rhodomonas_salina.1